MATMVRRPGTAFSKSPPRKSRRREREEGHLAWIRTLPCVLRGRRGGVEAAHIRFADPIYGKPETPAGKKPDDRWTVPLHHEEHRTGNDAQHNSNEREWWARRGLDPVAIAAALWGCTGHDEEAEVILREARSRYLTFTKPKAERG